MARIKRVEFDEANTATAEPATLGTYVVTFNPQSRVMPHSITMVGCRDGEDAKQKLLDHIAESIQQIERKRG